MSQTPDHRLITIIRNAIVCAALAVSVPCICATSYAQTTGELIQNGGFEGGGGPDGLGAGIPRWKAWNLGYEVDRTVFHTGEQSARCESNRATGEHGAVVDITLNQARPSPVVVSGWSRADNVSGQKDIDYSLYIDVEYMDGTPLYAQTALFRTGTHDWERRQVLISPSKPIRRMNVIALFRHHSGTVWFDDFTANQMDGTGIFDSQPLLPLARRSAEGGSQMLRSGDGLALGIDAVGNIVSVLSGGQRVQSATTGGFWLRDVAAGTAPAPMRGKSSPRPGGGINIETAADALQLRLNARLVPDKESGTLSLDGDVTDLTGGERAVTVYFALPVAADGWSWGQDIHRSTKISAKSEEVYLTHINVGAVSGISLYPIGCVYNSSTGLCIANQMDMPSVYRIFYNGPTHQLVVAWDFALSSKTSSWPKHQAHFHASLFSLSADEAKWGFRAALNRFYKINAPAYNRLAKPDGLWSPFISPEKIKGFQDFGFAYHEGDNSKKDDNQAGILNFRYTEPMTWWMSMPPDVPRTYEAAMAMVKDLATKPEPITPKTAHPTPGEMAKALLNSGTYDEAGRFNVEFNNAPWSNGAVFVLNPNPEMASGTEHLTKGWLNYNPTLAKAMYGADGARLNGVQDGEYLDSLEGWSDTLDFRPENLAASTYPLTFETDSRKTTLPQWYSTHAFTRYLRDDLHNRSKLLMANTTPVKYSIYSSLLDVMGIEVNWLNEKSEFTPDGDETMSLRRSMSGPKPYLLLQNTNFDKFDRAMVERYMRTSMFYGIFPSMFSANASDHLYWENPTWLERDRSLFTKYIPIIKQLSAQGWEPIPYAETPAPGVYVERFGTRRFTIRNLNDKPVTTVINIAVSPLKIPLSGLKAIDLPTGYQLKSRMVGDKLEISVELGADDSTAIDLRP